MRRYSIALLALIAIAMVSMLIGRKTATVRAEGKPGAGFAAIPGQVGGQDIFGPYEIVKDWPKNISTLPGNEKWTWGAGQGIYAENPNRIFLVFRGELPNIQRPKAKLLPEFGPSMQFPIGRLPWRDATVAALPGAGGPGRIPGRTQTAGKAPSASTPNGNIASPSWMPTATSSNAGRNGTRS